jgi:hypothetical protein
MGLPIDSTLHLGYSIHLNEVLATAMAVQRSNSFLYDPSADTEYPARFRFAVTWSYLLVPNEIGKPTAEISSGQPLLFTARAPLEAERPTTVPAVSGRRTVHDSPKPSPKPSKDQSKQWEMVIPKMPQPATRLVQVVQPKPIAAPEPVSKPTIAAPPPTISDAPFLSRPPKTASPPWKWILAMATVAGAAFSVWGMLPAPKAAPTRPASPVSRAHWVRERAMFVVGSKEERQLILYRGSQQASDFHAEFDWKPDPKGAGLIFRAADRGNYQALRVGIATWRPSLTLFEEHFAVVGGIETTHARKLIPWTTSSTPIHIALDGSGFEFLLNVEGAHFDYWTDNRFKKGDVGFYEDRDEQRSLESVRFTFPNHLMPDFSGALESLP